MANGGNDRGVQVWPELYIYIYIMNDSISMLVGGSMIHVIVQHIVRLFALVDIYNAHYLIKNKIDVFLSLAKEQQ